MIKIVSADVSAFIAALLSAVDNDLPASKYLQCKSPLPETEEIKLRDNNDGSIRPDLFEFSAPRYNYVTPHSRAVFRLQYLL